MESAKWSPGLMGLHSSTLDYCFNLVLTLAYPILRVLSTGARAYARLWRLLIRAKQCAINPLSLRRLGGANVLLGAGFCGVICICVALWMARTLACNVYCTLLPSNFFTFSCDVKGKVHTKRSVNHDLDEVCSTRLGFIQSCVQTLKASHSRRLSLLCKCFLEKA